MSRIVERPASTKEVARYRSRCGALVEYELADVKCDQRDGDYVVCPACGGFIAASLLQWVQEPTP